LDESTDNVEEPAPQPQSLQCAIIDAGPSPALSSPPWNAELAPSSEAPTPICQSAVLRSADPDMAANGSFQGDHMPADGECDEEVSAGSPSHAGMDASPGSIGDGSLQDSLQGMIHGFQSSAYAQRLSHLTEDLAGYARSFLPYDTCHSTPEKRVHEIDVTGDCNMLADYKEPSSKKSEKAAVHDAVLFPTQFKPHAIFDDYDFVGGLSGGIGAFGKIEIVQKKGTDHLRACKVVKVESSEVRGLIDTEVKLLKSLVHPNIVKLHSVYMHDASPDRLDASMVYIVCEYCQGGELNSRIKYHKEVLKEPMSEKQIAYIFQQILSATQFCHDKGIVHRDLKPQNILFQTRSSSSTIKIIDFGLADFVSVIQQSAREKRLSKKDDIDILCPGTDWLAQVPDLLLLKTGLSRTDSKRHVMQLAGTCPYMAPEVFNGWYDHRFDMFSVGIMLYETLFEEHPFCSMCGGEALDDRETVKARILSEDPAFPGTRSYGSRDLCRQLLEKDPGKRLNAAAALQHAWFKDSEIQKHLLFGNEQELTMSKLHGLVSYTGYNKFKRAVYLMLAQELSEQQTQELRKLFMALDVSGDGVLSPDELYDGMQHVGLVLPREEFAKLVVALCPSDSQRIQYREFISALIHRRVTLDRAQLLECFRKFDTRGAGYICLEDVQNALSTGDANTPGITESEWAEVLTRGGLEATDTKAFELTFENFVMLLEPSMRSSAASAA